ncbi:EGF-containing fibulin-like extracellular matrix protein 1 [Protopterus annectens]|uniref:EGF-containing fibulin-like extracellular matrix protein 1 n=1 Tax=Protopterus annectens TaxID=7888 RepID=UPI001CF9E43C|nr:EGF-containing fibulin-like extracellular matrix protein 1 [Protopterus annectens]
MLQLQRKNFVLVIVVRVKKEQHILVWNLLQNEQQKHAVLKYGFDIDECSANVSVCPSRESCVNSLGSFGCNCNSGYEGDNCTDIDECGYANDCDVNALCGNTEGSYLCTCKTGYTGNGTYCTDIDECAAGNYACPLSYQDCANSIGSFTCYCKSGYYLENDTCKDTNECESETVCANKGEMCINLEGSYECQCRHGYQNTKGTCADVNECITPDLNNCSLTTAICSNYDGSYMCQCKAGYSGDGVNCTGMSCQQEKITRTMLIVAIDHIANGAAQAADTGIASSHLTAFDKLCQKYQEDLYQCPLQNNNTFR